MIRSTRCLSALVVVAALAWAAAASGAVGTVPVRLELAAKDLALTRVGEATDLEPPAGAASAWTSRGTDPVERNPMVAFLMSAVLPGWGEIYTGHTTRGRSFIATEAAIWIGYAAFTVQGGLRTDDYEEYARIFAGVPEGSSSGYYADVADYIRSEGAGSYNEAVRKEARSLYPDDLEAQRRYLAENGYFGSRAWEWESETRFDHYRTLRHDASISYRNAFYMTGLAILNRAVSAIDSAWMARRHNQGVGGEPGPRVSVSPEFSEGSVGSRVTVEIPF
jgi:hypothetical protein